MKCYVNVYAANLEFGGPEEGGWWYTSYELVRSVPTSTRYAQQIKKNLGERYNNDGRPPLSSVASSGRYHVAIERTFAPLVNRARPHYE